MNQQPFTLLVRMNYQRDFNVGNGTFSTRTGECLLYNHCFTLFLYVLRLCGVGYQICLWVLMCYLYMEYSDEQIEHCNRRST